MTYLTGLLINGLVELITHGYHLEGTEQISPYLAVTVIEVTVRGFSMSGSRMCSRMCSRMYSRMYQFGIN
jgi:hypothetical protein